MADTRKTPLPKISSAGLLSPSIGRSDAINRRSIAERISTLLSHYWTAADAPELRALQAADWLNDLDEFPAPLVASACQEWRRTQTRRPTIADIRGLCVAASPGKPPPPNRGGPVSRPDEVAAYEASRAESYAQATAWRESAEGKAWHAAHAPGAAVALWRDVSLPSETLDALVARLEKRGG